MNAEVNEVDFSFINKLWNSSQYTYIYSDIKQQWDFTGFLNMDHYWENEGKNQRENKTQQPKTTLHNKAVASRV